MWILAGIYSSWPRALLGSYRSAGVSRIRRSPQLPNRAIQAANGIIRSSLVIEKGLVCGNSHTESENLIKLQLKKITVSWGRTVFVNSLKYCWSSIRFTGTVVTRQVARRSPWDAASAHNESRKNRACIWIVRKEWKRQEKTIESKTEKRFRDRIWSSFFLTLTLYHNRSPVFKVTLFDWIHEFIKKSLVHMPI